MRFLHVENNCRLFEWSCTIGSLKSLWFPQPKVQDSSLGWLMSLCKINYYKYLWTILGCKVLLVRSNSTFLAMYLWSLVFSILCFQNINHTSTFSWSMPKILHILNQVLASILLALLFIAISGFRCKVFIKVYMVEERIILMYGRGNLLIMLILAGKLCPI